MANKVLLVRKNYIRNKNSQSILLNINIPLNIPHTIIFSGSNSPTEIYFHKKF